VILDANQLATGASWVATTVGIGLWAWSWLREKNAIQKVRFMDCGAVLLFASVLLRIVIQEKAMTIWDWAMIFVGPLFIGAALWRLGRNGCPPPRS